MANNNNNNVVYVYNNENNLNQENNNQPLSNVENDNLLTFIEKANVEKVNKYLTNGKKIPSEALVTAALKASFATANVKDKSFQIFQRLLDSGFYKDIALSRVAGSNGEFAPLVMEMLAEKGAEINPSDPSKMPPIFNAIESGSFQTFIKCVELGANLEKTYKDVPPIYTAVDAARPDIVEYLLWNKVKINYVSPINDNLFITALKIADPSIRRKICSLFLAIPSLKADFQNFSKKSALMIAADTEDIDLFDMILSDKRFLQSVQLKDRDGKTVVDLVTLKSSLSPIEHDKSKEAIYDRILLRLIAKVGNKFGVVKAALLPQGTSLLAQAILINKDDFIRQIITSGAENINAKLFNGHTPLTLAIKENAKPRTIQTLLELGAKVDDKNDLGVTPLTEAFLTGDPKLFEFIKNAYRKQLGYEPGAEEYNDILFGLAIKPSDLSYEKVFSDFGFDPKTNAKQDGKTLLMLASESGNIPFVEFLLGKGVVPNEDIDQPANASASTSAYGMAKNIEMRLLLAPFYETEKSKFTGFSEAEFDKFQSLFLTFDINNNNGSTSRVVDRIIDGAICPICFSLVDREDGCMYVSHNCMDVKDRAARSGNAIFVHKQLYDTYKQNNLIKWCCLCNRLTGDFVGHGHLHLNIAPPIYYKKPQALLTYRGNARLGERGGDPFDKNCNKQAGGNAEEKMYRYQKLLEFYCFLNREFVGKISKDMAERLVREYFIGCTVDEHDYFTQVDRYKPSASLLFEEKPVVKSEAIQKFEELYQRIISERRLFRPDDCGSSAVTEVDVEIEENENAANVPRHPDNVGLLPRVIPQVAIDAEEPPPPPRAAANNVRAKYRANYAAFQQLITDNGIRKCEYHGEFHLDGRDLYQFFHRQPLRYGGGVYDHEDSLICKEALVEFIQFLNMGSTTIGCFDTINCKGHIHPLEIQPIFTEDDEKQVWEEYRKRFNKFPPTNLRAPAEGGSRAETYTHFYVDKNTTSGTCPLPRRRIGGKRKTRRPRKLKARTHKHPKKGMSKRYTQTRKQ